MLLTQSCVVERLPVATTTVVLELHIVFHTVYQTPALYFRAVSVDGSPIPTDRVLRDVHLAGRSTGAPVATVEEHSVLGVPFALLHPCETASAMDLLIPQAQLQQQSVGIDSDDSMAIPRYLMSWLSLVQPVTGISPMDYYPVP